MKTLRRGVYALATIGVLVGCGGGTTQPTQGARADGGAAGSDGGGGVWTDDAGGDPGTTGPGEETPGPGPAADGGTVAKGDSGGTVTKRDGSTGGNTNTPPPPFPAAQCGATATVVLQEMATGQPDYVVLKNTGSAPVDLNGFQLHFAGITNKPTSYTFKASKMLDAGKTLYVVEYQTTKPDEIGTAANIPFFDGPPNAARQNAVALYDTSGKLLDYLAIGAPAVSLPQGATFTAVAWPSGFLAKTHSFQRTGQKGSCPGFDASDWGAAPITRK